MRTSRQRKEAPGALNPVDAQFALLRQCKTSAHHQALDCVGQQRFAGGRLGHHPHRYHPLPLRPNLEHLKRQAKDLLRAYRAGDVSACRLVEQHLSQPLEPGPDNNLGLAEAQRRVALEYGFASWPKLKQHVETVLAAQRSLAMQSATPDSRETRKFAGQHRTKALAERLIAAAREPDLGPVFRALILPARTYSRSACIWSNTKPTLPSSTRCCGA